MAGHRVTDIIRPTGTATSRRRYTYLRNCQLARKEEWTRSGAGRRVVRNWLARRFGERSHKRDATLPSHNYIGVAAARLQFSPFFNRRIIHVGL